jgi:hypothetical protein
MERNVKGYMIVIYTVLGGVGLGYFVWKIVSGFVFQSDNGWGIGEVEAARMLMTYAFRPEPY